MTEAGRDLAARIMEGLGPPIAGPGQPNEVIPFVIDIDGEQFAEQRAAMLEALSMMEVDMPERFSPGSNLANLRDALRKEQR